jgi:RimJ/RimL family protein N-acetyltransferase
MTSRQELIVTRRVDFRLITATDAHFAWLLGAPAPDSLTLAEGGLETPEILTMLRGIAAELRHAIGAGAWLIVAGTEVVGLISYMAPPDQHGHVEIGFGIAATRRRRGHVTRAVAELIALTRAQNLATCLSAEAKVDNIGSQSALTRNGFVACHTRLTEEDGEVIGWQLPLT